MVSQLDVPECTALTSANSFLRLLLTNTNESTRASMQAPLSTPADTNNPAAFKVDVPICNKFNIKILQ